MKRKIFGIIISLIIVVSGVLFAQRAPSITMNKRVWKIGERIEVKASGLNKNLKYRISAFFRQTNNNNNPIKTRSIKGKTKGSVFMRLRADQGVKAGKYEFHLYRPGKDNIISKVNLVLVNDDVDPVDPVDPDPGPSTGNKIFTASSGTTDLNYADTTTFISEYSKLGYKNTSYQKKVKKSQLTSFLTNKNQMHFHSGHGSSNGSISCTDGSLYVKNLSGKIQVVYSIYAICSSFASSDWSRVMGSNAKMVMGFNKTVTDGSCLNMAKAFPAQLAKGESYPMAWYKANSAINGHKDRWAMYVKEGSKIVLYKAGGNTPRYFPGRNLIHLSDWVTAEEQLLEYWSHENFGRSVGPFIVNRVRLKINKKGKWPTKKSKFTLDQALTKTFDMLGKDLPINAKFDKSVIIERCHKGNNCTIVAHNINFVSEYNGLKIRSNSIGNYISVLVNEEITVVDSQWSQIMLDVNTTLNLTLSVEQALSISADQISSIIREPVSIVKYEKVYGLSGEDKLILVPAFEFIGSKGERFVVSAFNGELI